MQKSEAGDLTGVTLAWTSPPRTARIFKEISRPGKKSASFMVNVVKFRERMPILNNEELQFGVK
jgi:hypothetical protein